MSGHQKCEECTHDQELLVCSETQGPDVAQESKAVEEPSASSLQPLISSNMKEVAIPEIPSTPEGLLISCSSSIAIPATTLSQTKGISTEEENSPITSAMAVEAEHVPKSPLDEKVAFLVKFMLLKYQVKEPFTKDDVLHLLIGEDEGYFRQILLRASERLELIFGLEVKEVDPFNHCYCLSIMLGLTYDGMANDEDGVPKTGILILMLSLIFMKGNRATENEVWEVLSITGFHRNENHFIFGNPEQLIFHEFVKEKYLEYQQVANSDPVQYEFLWGPRAYAETSKMKVLEFMAKVHRISPSDFPDKHEEALLEEEERALARNSVRSGSGPMSTASSSAADGRFFHIQ